MKNIKITIIGLGYVGLPLAVEFAKKLVKSVGYKLENVPFIPVSGWKSMINTPERR